MPHAKTVEYVRSEVLAQIRFIAEYWAALPDKTPAERCDGVAFSILVMIDGEMALPGMTLSLAPHEEDRKYYESRGENWYESGMVINGDVALHEEYCRMGGESRGENWYGPMVTTGEVTELYEEYFWQAMKMMKAEEGE